LRRFGFLLSAAAFCERSASCLTSSENLSAPVAMDARAKLVVFAATVPKAAANFRPEANAASARSSAALIDSLEGEISLLPRDSLFDLRRVLGATLRDFLRANRWSHGSLIYSYLRCRGDYSVFGLSSFFFPENRCDRRYAFGCTCRLCSSRSAAELNVSPHNLHLNFFSVKIRSGVSFSDS
jgi:hypothetical protein